MSDDTKTPLTPVTMQPLYDCVLVKLDVKKPHALDPRALRRGKPKILPSGTVVAVGNGTIVPGVGLVPLTVKVGDRVGIYVAAIDNRQPLVDDEEQVYCIVRETSITGILHGAEPGSAWFGEDSRDSEFTLQ